MTFLFVKRSDKIVNGKILLTFMLQLFYLLTHFAVFTSIFRISNEYKDRVFYHYITYDKRFFIRYTYRTSGISTIKRKVKKNGGGGGRDEENSGKPPVTTEIEFQHSLLRVLHPGVQDARAQDAIAERHEDIDRRFSCFFSSSFFLWFLAFCVSFERGKEKDKIFLDDRLSENCLPWYTSNMKRQDIIIKIKIKFAISNHSDISLWMFSLKISSEIKFRCCLRTWWYFSVLFVIIKLYH